MKSADLTRMVDAFDVFRPQRLLFTKVDETTSFGPIVNESARTGKPVSFLATGQRIPEDLETASASRLVDLILTSGRCATAVAAAEQRLQRSPGEEDVAEQLGITIGEYHEWLVEIRGLNIASLEYAGSEDGKDLLQYIPEEGERLPSTLLERSELERLLAKGIDDIPAIEQTVLSLYYKEELTLREIAQVVKLHESRISQLKSQAILRLRSHMAEQWPTARGMVTV